MEGMTEQEMEQRLGELMDELGYLDSEERARFGMETAWLEDAQARSFEAAGVFTMNRGIALRLHDGSEFQITIVRSK
jgi:hypothetical protein